MTRFSLVLALFVGSSLIVAPQASAHDWFVRAGASAGDGSLAKPFADPWQALEKCEAGDALHVAEGKYYGRSSSGMWKIPYDGVQIYGGYDQAFKERDPWRHLTELLWDKDSKNRPNDNPLVSNAENVVVDGIVVDMQNQNDYDGPERSGRKEKYNDEAAMRFGKSATVRNSVILNAGTDGIQCAGKSVIENNLIVNAVGFGVQVKTLTGSSEVTTVRNNTIVFTWTFKKPGLGAYEGSAVAAQGPTDIIGNILAHNDDQGVYQTANPAAVSIAHNVFFMNLYANVKFSADGNWVGIDDKNMDMLEEGGFKAYDGNEVKNPLLPIDRAWMDKYSKRTAAQEGKLDMDDWNKARQVLGLPLIEKGGSAAGGIAPPWDLQKALALLHPKGAGDAGARVKKLPVKFSGTGAVAAAPARDYQHVELWSWSGNPESVDGKPLEMVVGVGAVANVSGMPSQYSPDSYGGFFLFDKDGKEQRVTGFYKKGSAPDRALSSATGWYQGSGVPDHLYVVRGVAYSMKSYPKAGFLVESVEPYEAAPAAQAARPKGRDWFVRAGAKGGDGSRAKPFKDPYQALDKANSGDTIHVAEGEYYGKLHAGNWFIKKPYIALLGGYDASFQQRNPWKHPTFLRTGPDFRGHREGYTIEGGQDDHTGAIVDGFVFDKKGDNQYKSSGDLDYDNSDKNQIIWFARPDCVIRNSVFVNGAEGALRVANGETIENNIFVNFFRKMINVSSGFTTAPFVFRNNTAAFSWASRFGQGHGYPGTLLYLEGRSRAVIDSNIFEFADNDAVRLAADPKDVELTNNVFGHNLWSDVMQPNPGKEVFVDDKSFSQLADVGFKKVEGNKVMNSGLPVDRKWFDVYLSRTAYVPGKVSMDDWNQVREILGQPLIATGGSGGSGLMPALDWHEAVSLFPKNPKVKAGARAKDLPVQFNP